MNCILYSLTATVCTWLITAMGSAVVLLFKNPKLKTMNRLLGFSAGVMIAASFWSLLEPAVNYAEKITLLSPAFVVTFGFLFGCIFMYFSDKTATKIQTAFGKTKAKIPSDKNKILLLVLSVTLHNIPEGLAIGVAFGSLKGASVSTESLMSAISIAIGIGIQNFPEGAAVSLPLRREGYSRLKSFLIGQASGIVEPISGVIGAILVIYIEKIMPFALSFAAGAMILVAVHELIPECRKNQNENSYFSTMGIISGFAVMTFFDVALG